MKIKNNNNLNNRLFKLERPAKLDIDIPDEEDNKIEKNNADQLERTPKFHRKDMGKRGFYDKRNVLNDLTGKEWKFMSKSVITRSYPPDLQHGLRKQHGGQKPPLLCSDLIKTFTKKGEKVLDPLMGVGGTLFGAALCGRNAVGIEINKKWIDIYKKVCELEDLKELKTFNDDCRNVLKKANKNSVDFILTDVPYWNMDKVEKTRSKIAIKSNLSQFNENNMQTKQEWLDELVDIFNLCYRVLKNKKYLAIFIGDMYRGKEYHILSADLASAISKKTSFILKANLIWYDVSKNLHVYGQPYAYIPSMIHQNVLIFKKEE
ncbi:MAG: DNA methyltransferase [Patescibacteria group bacterium]